MARNNRVLLEKYTSIIESDKEDVLSGLESLSSEDPYKLAQDIYNYCIEQKKAFSRTTHREGYIERVSRYINDIFKRLEIPEVGWPTQKDLVWVYLIDTINATTPSRKEKGLEHIVKAIEKGLEDRETWKNSQLQEDDKEDIMAGLEEIEQTSAESLTNKIYKKYIKLKSADPDIKWAWVAAMDKYINEIISDNKLNSLEADMGGGDKIDLKGFIWHYLSAMYSHPSMTDKFKDKIRHFIQQAIDKRDT